MSLEVLRKIDLLSPMHQKSGSVIGDLILEKLDTHSMGRAVRRWEKW